MVLLFKLAWRNLWRNGRRTLITVIALMLALVLMILYTGLMEGMVRQMERNVTDLSIGHFQIQHQDFSTSLSLYDTVEKQKQIVSKLKSLSIDAAPRWFGYGLAANDKAEKSTGVQIQGVNLDLEPTVTTVHLPKYIAEGQFLSDKVRTEASGKKGTNQGSTDLDLIAASLFGEKSVATTSKGTELMVEEIVLGVKVAQTLKAKIGDTLVLVTAGSDGSIGNELFEVVGVLKSIGDTFDRTRVMISKRAFARLFAFDTNSAHEIALGPSQLSRKQITEALQDQLSSTSVVKSWRQVMPLVSDMLSIVRVSTTILMLIIYAGAALVILNSILMMVFERFHEFGVMKAIGYKPRQIVALILLETSFLAVGACFVGWLFAAIGNEYLVVHGIDLTNYAPNGVDFSGTTVDPLMRSIRSISIYVEPTILLIGMALLSSLYPAWKAARVSALTAMGGANT